MVSEVVLKFGWGPVVAAGIAFILAFMVALSTVRKNNLEMKLAQNKDDREKAEADAKKRERDGSMKKAIDAAKLEGLEEGRDIQTMMENNFNKDRAGLQAELEKSILCEQTAERRAELAERRAERAEKRAVHAERQMRELRGTMRRLRQEGSSESQRTI